MTKVLIKYITVNFLNNIVPQLLLGPFTDTLPLLCKYDKGILIFSLKCLIKLY